MRLRAYMREQDLSDIDLADRLGVDRSILNRWKNGGRRPSAKYIILIARLTHGAVMPNDWFEIPIRRPRARKPARKVRDHDRAAAP